MTEQIDYLKRVGTRVDGKTIWPALNVMGQKYNRPAITQYLSPGVIVILPNKVDDIVQAQIDACRKFAENDKDCKAAKAAEQSVIAAANKAATQKDTSSETK